MSYTPDLLASIVERSDG